MRHVLTKTSWMNEDKIEALIEANHRITTRETLATRLNLSNFIIVKRHSVSLSWEEMEITFRTARNIFRTNGRKLKNFDTYSYVCFFHTWFTLTGHICTNDSDNWSHTRSSCPLCWKIWDRFENNPIRFAPCTNPKWQVLWNCFVREHSKSVPNLPLLFARAKNCSI